MAAAATHSVVTLTQGERIRAAFQQLSEVSGGRLQAACHVASEVCADESLPTQVRRIAWQLLERLHYCKTVAQIEAEERARGLR